MTEFEESALLSRVNQTSTGARRWSLPVRNTSLSDAAFGSAISTQSVNLITIDRDGSEGIVVEKRNAVWNIV
jgi:hypothetical protein